MLQEEIVLVDRDDNEIGIAEKLETHRRQISFGRALDEFLLRPSSSRRAKR